MKYYIIAGERSGDLHAANLLRELKKVDAQAVFRGFGGDMMAAEGMNLTVHYQELAIMGFIEAVANLKKILGYLSKCKKDIKEFEPDVIVLVDYAGFNMRMAKWAKDEGYKVYYYISPKVWAWNQARAKRVKALVDRMFVILPFEEEFYEGYDYKVDYVGNPVLDAISEYMPSPDFRKENELDERPIIAILPGSRKQEVETMLHYMLSVIPGFQDYQFVIAAVPSLERKYYEQFRRKDTIKIVYDQTYDLLAHAEGAVVTSGTATLETALFNVPQVVCYRASTVSYIIARSLIKVKYISLVNLIAGREVVTELIQDDFTPSNLVKEMKLILRDKRARAVQLENYRLLKEQMGEAGASRRTAELMVGYLKEGK